MSFFRNLRSSITRGRSSSRDTTPVRSRPGSIISSLNNVGTNGNGKRRDSTESRTDSLLNRSDTFILDESQDVTPIHSNCSTLEKKSKKSKVLEKFSTFTKRKKTPTPEKAFDHHPSDNATNTYYKYQADGGNSLDYDSQTDPFNFLYEQQSSLKSLHGNQGPSSNTESLRSAGSNSSTNYDSATYRKGGSKGNFDSGTYRKGKMPMELKKQLVQLKQKTNLQERENDDDDEINDREQDKFKTVTLNSFRKSFREKFLQQQKDAAHNPAWFVEVEPPAANEPRESSKENRRDLLVFENDNYRPGSRSPVRDPNKNALRTQTRSPIKRNETFKVDRVSRADRYLSNKPEDTTSSSIRIEFKNSITPHMPGRVVPVGVAKPILAQFNATYPNQSEPTTMNTSYTIKTNSTSSTRLNNHSPPRNWSKPLSPGKPLMVAPTQRMGRYQTLVQIKNDKAQQSSPVTTRTSRLSTRIQLAPDSYSKRSNISSSPTKYQPLKQTYFGETPYSSTPQQSRILQTASYTNPTIGLRTTVTPANYGRYQPVTYPVATSNATTISAATRLTPSHSNHNNSNTHSGFSTSSSSSYLKHQQPRIVVAAQRRSRSPIKIPWR